MREGLAALGALVRPLAAVHGLHVQVEATRAREDLVALGALESDPAVGMLDVQAKGGRARKTLAALWALLMPLVLEHLHATGAVVRRAEVMLEATDSDPGTA